MSLHRALNAIAAAARPGMATAELVELGRGKLHVDRLDYLEIVDAESLRPLERVERPARACVAAFVGRTRLIDNVAVDVA